MDESEAMLGGQGVGVVAGFAQGLALEYHLGAVVHGMAHLDVRRRRRHDDGRGDPQPVGMVSDALGVVARRHGDDARPLFRLIETEQGVERTPFLERGGELMVLELDEDLGAGKPGEGQRSLGLGPHDRTADRRRRVADVVEGHRMAVPKSGGHVALPNDCNVLPDSGVHRHGHVITGVAAGTLRRLPPSRQAARTARQIDPWASCFEHYKTLMRRKGHRHLETGIDYVHWSTGEERLR